MKHSLSLIVLGAALLSIPASGAVFIESINNGDGLGTIDMNVAINGSGTPSTGSPWFSVSGSVSEAGAFGGTVGITFDAGKNISTVAATRGDELSDGTFDRDDDGFMGVQGNPNAGGIGGADGGDHEGITFILDELTSISPTVGIQIMSIDVRNVGRAGTDPADESFTVVNLLTRDFLTFTPIGDSHSQGNFDVSSLNLYLAGGSSGSIAALYSGDTGGFRVNGLTIETIAIPEPSAVLLGGLGFLALLRRRRD